MWPTNKLTDLIGCELPILQAPMAGANGSQMAIAVCEAGGVGALPCAMLESNEIRSEIAAIRADTDKPLNLNFFCHATPTPDQTREARWLRKLTPYYTELGVNDSEPTTVVKRAPFDDAMCALVEETRPEIVSFHFGLPQQTLLESVKATGALVLSSATTVQEAIWLESKGCDAIIAQGYEAGGHRGMFLNDSISTQAGTIALVPQVVDAVKVPVIAAGGITDGRGIAAAFALGAAGVLIGTAYLFTPESLITPLYRSALLAARDDQTALTNIFSGRPARGLMNRIMREIGPISEEAPAFPTAGGALAPIKARAEAQGLTDFTALWSGQAASLGREMSAGELTQRLAQDALAHLQSLSGA